MIKRRKYFIEKGFQTKFILKFCLIVIAGSLIVGGLLFLLSRGSTTVAIENTKVAVKNTADFLFPLILSTLIIVTLFSAISVSILCLFVSHKIVGPLYRLKKEIQMLGEGNLNVNFRIRAGDQLKELAGSLDEMTSSLRERIKAFKGEFQGLLPRLEESSQDKDKLATIKKTLEFFKV